MTISEMIKKCHETAKTKGWWDEVDGTPERTFGDQVALMHSELSEALEEFRVFGLDPLRMLYLAGDVYQGAGDKPEGVAAEFADVLIRIFDTCGRYGIPLEEALVVKMAYNATRPHRHGGKKL